MTPEAGIYIAVFLLLSSSLRAVRVAYRTNLNPETWESAKERCHFDSEGLMEPPVSVGEGEYLVQREDLPKDMKQGASYWTAYVKNIQQFTFLGCITAPPGKATFSFKEVPDVGDCSFKCDTECFGVDITSKSCHCNVSASDPSIQHPCKDNDGKIIVYRKVPVSNGAITVDSSAPKNSACGAVLFSDQEKEIFMIDCKAIWNAMCQQGVVVRPAALCIKSIRSWSESLDCCEGSELPRITPQTIQDISFENMTKNEYYWTTLRQEMVIQTNGKRYRDTECGYIHFDTGGHLELLFGNCSSVNYYICESGRRSTPDTVSTTTTLTTEPASTTRTSLEQTTTFKTSEPTPSTVTLPESLSTTYTEHAGNPDFSEEAGGDQHDWVVPIAAGTSGAVVGLACIAVGIVFCRRRRSRSRPRAMGCQSTEEESRPMSTDYAKPQVASRDPSKKSNNGGAVVNEYGEVQGELANPGDNVTQTAMTDVYDKLHQHRQPEVGPQVSDNVYSRTVFAMDANVYDTASEGQGRTKGQVIQENVYARTGTTKGAPDTYDTTRSLLGQQSGPTDSEYDSCSNVRA